MPSEEDAEHGFSVHPAVGRRQWTNEEMQRAVPLPSPQLDFAGSQVPDKRILIAILGRVSAQPTIVEEAASDLDVPISAIMSCIDRLLGTYRDR